MHSRASSFALDQMTTAHLGQADQVRVTSDHTTIIGGHGAPSARERRLSQLRAELERATIGTDQDFLSERIARLSGKAAVIKVGAPTNAEAKEVRHRVDDALQATRAAMAEGILAGGGSALLHAEPALSDLDVHGDYRVGVEIVRAALTEPVHLIAANAGYDADEVVKQVASMAVDEGFDALQGRFGNLVELGVIDPLRVVRSGPPERRLGGRAGAHDRLAGRRGADALEQVAHDRVRPAGRGPAAALARRQHAAVPRPRSVHGLTGPPAAPRARRLAARALQRRPSAGTSPGCLNLRRTRISADPYVAVRRVADPPSAGRAAIGVESEETPRMRAVRVHRYHQDPTIDDIGEPKLTGPLDVIVKIGGAGVCRTDLHILEGQWAEVQNPRAALRHRARERRLGARGRRGRHQRRRRRHRDPASAAQLRAVPRLPGRQGHAVRERVLPRPVRTTTAAWPSTCGRRRAPA